MKRFGVYTVGYHRVYGTIGYKIRYVVLPHPSLLCHQDYLQAPLQPLADNLESQTYEAFEKDPVKYSQYEKAIVKALQAEKEKQANRGVTVLMVGKKIAGGYMHYISSI